MSKEKVYYEVESCENNCERINELEQQNKELRSILFELYSYDFHSLDWNEAGKINFLIESVLNK